MPPAPHWTSSVTVSRLRATAAGDLQELIATADWSELRGRRIVIRIEPRAGYVAQVGPRVLRGWMIRMHFGLLAATNYLLLLLFDEAATPAKRAAQLRAYMAAVVRGELPPRYPDFPATKVTEIEVLGRFCKWFILAHELGHIVSAARGDRFTCPFEEEFAADKWGWLLYYGRAQMMLPPFDELHSAGEMPTSWDRQRWIEQNGDRFAQLVNEMSSERRAFATAMNHCIWAAPHLVFRSLEYLERAFREAGVMLARTHPPAADRRPGLLAHVPAALTDQVLLKTLRPLDEAIPAPA
ncbi:MAG: hypothetical protein KF866_04205 [Phycisphaeraceae bacterium]|nr:hypothetical protein [Phycisphaeraceae bacterium]